MMDKLEDEVRDLYSELYITQVQLSDLKKEEKSLKADYRSRIKELDIVIESILDEIKRKRVDD